MNNSLPIFYSKSSLTSRIADYSNVYLLPLVCLFGMITSLISIVVILTRNPPFFARLLKRELHALNKTLDYILLNSLIDFTFLLVESFLFIIRCGTLCPHGFTYTAKFYEIYVYLYLGYVLIGAQVFLNIYVAFDMLQMLNAKTYVSQGRGLIYVVTLICVTMSITVNLPVFLLSKQIVPFGIYMPNGPNSTHSELLYTSVIRPGFETRLAQDLLTLCLVIKNPVMYISLVVLNILVIKRYRKYIKSKKTLVSPAQSSSVAASSVTQTASSRLLSQKESSFTQLTILYCVIYFGGNLLDTFAMISNIFMFDIYVKHDFVSIAGNFFLFLSHGVRLFFNYRFNSIFRQKFHQVVVDSSILKRIRFLSNKA